MKKALLVLALIGGALLSTGSSGPASAYWGSSKSDIYHLPSCTWAKKIADQNKIVFPTKEAAQKKGYRPCKVCKP